MNAIFRALNSMRLRSARFRLALAMSAPARNYRYISFLLKKEAACLRTLKES